MKNLLPFLIFTAVFFTACGEINVSKEYVYTDSDENDNKDQDDEINDDDVAPAFNFIQVSVGLDHSCALDAEGSAYCWGWGWFGQLGNGKSGIDYFSSIPVKVYKDGVLKNRKLVSIDSGRYHTCAIDEEGDGFCWGKGNVGQLGNNSQDNSAVPVAVNNKVRLKGKKLKLISAGFFHTCAVDTDGKLFCWGENGHQQLGRETWQSFSLVPINADMSRVMENRKVVSISCGYKHSCAIDDEGTAYCWGSNEDNVFGTEYSTPYQMSQVYAEGVLKGKKLAMVSVGLFHTCVIDIEGKAFCWGSNELGQIGTTAVTYSIHPVEVYTGDKENPGILFGKKLISIDSGYYQSCASDKDKYVYCWGSLVISAPVLKGENPDGGDESLIRNMMGEPLRSFSSGYSHMCVVKLDGGLVCSGNSDYGKLGE
ncbi:MAG TPA: hypothetical protein PKG52_00560 [bacterium]|nr:hypothetical protein [bacterium]